MFSDRERRCLVRAARCFDSLDGHKTLLAMATLAGLKRFQDAFAEHVGLVRRASRDAAQPGIALMWVPGEHRGGFTTNAGVVAACKALEEENPSLEGAFTALWPGARDSEVAAAWPHLAEPDWRTSTLLGLSPDGLLRLGEEETVPVSEERLPHAPHTFDVVGETYEMLKGELKIRVGDRLGEFFTPETVVWMMVAMTGPQLGHAANDPCCGSGRMMLVTGGYLLARHGCWLQETGPDHPLGAGHRLVTPPPALLTGQDLAPHGPAMARISLTALGYLNSVFTVGDSLGNPLTRAKAVAMVEERRAKLLAVQPRHLVTDDIPALVTVTTPRLETGLTSTPVAPTPRRKPAAKSAPTTTLEAFGAEAEGAAEPS